MKIFVNCSNLTSGGGLSVGLGVLQSLYEIEGDHQFVVVVPNAKNYAAFTSNEKIELIKNNAQSYFSKLFLEWRLAKLVERHQCDAILSLSNYAIPSNLPQSLLMHWPYAVYPEKEIWNRMRYFNKLHRKLRLFKLRYLLPNSNTLIVQTNVMKKRARTYLVPKKEIVVIPSSTGFMGNNQNVEVCSQIDKLKEEGNKVLLCINEYYEHKNLEILIPLAKQIKAQNLKIRFVVTIVNDEFISKIKGLEDVILNVGRVARSETKCLFQRCDALFFPSLIESFGIPFVESQEVEMPIYTSDRDFAHDVCGDEAVYFDPTDVDDILKKIQMAPITVHKKPQQWLSITNQMLNTLG